MLAAPGDGVAIADREQQLELLRIQRVVVVEVVAEQRERFDERAAAGHDLGAAAGDEIDLSELLEDADGIIGAEHRHRARQADALGPGGDRRQRDRRCRHSEVRPVMLTDGEQVEAELVGELGLLEQILEALLRADPGAEVGECGKPKFHARQCSR